MISVFVTFLLISALISMLVNLLAMRTQPRDRRGYFFWGAMCQVLAVIALTIAIIFGLQYESRISDGNFLPFVYFICVFFMPAGIVSLLIGIFEPPDEERNPRT